MKAQKVMSITLKALGIYSIIQSFPMLQTSISYLSISRTVPDVQSTYLSFSALSLFPFLFLLSLGIFLIKSSSSISTKLLKEQVAEEESENKKITQLEIQSISFSAIGVLLICLSIPSLARSITTYSIMYQQSSGPQMASFLNLLPQFVSIIFQLSLGIFLFFGAKGLAHYWHKLQKTRPMAKDS